jgi:hypothetical protein
VGADQPGGGLRLLRSLYLHDQSARRRMKEGQVAETLINVAYAAAGDLHLRIAPGACRFKARPSEGDTWVAGPYYDPIDRRPARLLEKGASG